MKFNESSPLLEEGDSEINITPLIDIVFLLLIFFMVSTTFVRSQGIDVNLPSAQSGRTSETPSELLISITKDGELYIGKEKTSLATLSAKLKENLSSTLIIQADDLAQHGLVVKVMDIAKSTGIQKMAIATSPSSNSKSP